MTTMELAKDKVHHKVKPNGEEVWCISYRKEQYSLVDGRWKNVYKDPDSIRWTNRGSGLNLLSFKKKPNGNFVFSRLIPGKLFFEKGSKKGDGKQARSNQRFTGLAIINSGNNGRRILIKLDGYRKWLDRTYDWGVICSVLDTFEDSALREVIERELAIPRTNPLNKWASLVIDTIYAKWFPQAKEIWGKEWMPHPSMDKLLSPIIRGNRLTQDVKKALGSNCKEAMKVVLSRDLGRAAFLASTKDLEWNTRLSIAKYLPIKEDVGSAPYRPAYWSFSDLSTALRDTKALLSREWRTKLINYIPQVHSNSMDPEAYAAYGACYIRDILNMALKVPKDMLNKLCEQAKGPRDLHDKLSEVGNQLDAIKQAKVLKRKQARLKPIIDQTYKEWEWFNGSKVGSIKGDRGVSTNSYYTVVIPKNLDTLVDWGIQQKHCIASYADKHLINIILFGLVDKDNKLVYCGEVRLIKPVSNGKTEIWLSQLQGYRNAPAPMFLMSEVIKKLYSGPFRYQHPSSNPNREMVVYGEFV